MDRFETEIPAVFKENLDKCNRLRLLIRAQYPPPFGGISSLVVSLVSGLKQYKADNVVVLHYGEKNETRFVGECKVYCFNLKKNIWRIFLPQNWKILIKVVVELGKFQLSLSRLIKESIKTILVEKVASENLSNVVSFYQSDAALEILPCKKMWGSTRAIILTVFGELFDNKKFIMTRQSLFVKLIDAANYVLASSFHCACSFKKIGINRTIGVIYVGVEISRFNDPENRLRSNYRTVNNISDNASVLLFMGRFHPDMGLDSLIASIPVLVERMPKIKIILAGAKGPLCQLAFDCQAQFTENVMVINNVPFQDQPSLYAASDIVLAPSSDQRACMGVTIKEAMAASRPVIGTLSGGIPEAIADRETGILVPLNSSGKIDKRLFESAIIDLLENKDRCVLMGKRGRERAEELFGESATIRRTIDIFSRSIPIV